MTSKTTLVYLHGVGDGDLENAWRDGLSSALVRCGYPSLDAVEIIAPKYPKALFGHPDDDKHEMPPVRVQALKGEKATAARRELEWRTGQLEAKLGVDDGGSTHPTVGAVVSAAARVKLQAARYLNNQNDARARVLKRVLDQIPPVGDVVIVGHSLGSVIALDLLRRLPSGVRVKGLITLGSPAGHALFQAKSDGLELRTPPANLGWWANFWSPIDLVTSCQGLSRAYPWVLDRRVPAPEGANAPYYAMPHAAVHYTADRGVAQAVGYALFGSLSKELVLASKSVDAPIQVKDAAQLMQIAYGHFVRDNIADAKLKERYQGALAVTHAQRALELRDAFASGVMPELIAEFVDAGKDFHREPAVPRLPRTFSTGEAASLILAVIQGTPITPYEIEVKDDVRRAAAAELSAAIGLGSKLGRQAFEALEVAGKVISPKRSSLRWWLIGAGAIALVVGTGGVALAAAPGVAGAAAITSALASFGPGGMLGGLITAGALTSSGTSAIAAGLARTGSVEAVESAVAYQVALSALRDRVGLDHEGDVWPLLVEMERQIARQRVHLAAFSDNDSPRLKDLDRKHRAVKNALDCLEKNNWRPAGLSDIADAEEAAFDLSEDGVVVGVVTEEV